MRWTRGTIVASVTHFLDERGRIAAPNASTLRLAEHLGAIVVLATATFRAPEDGAPGSLRCRARPRHRPCPGYIETDILPIYPDSDDDTLEIVWSCKHCGSNGLIRDWEGCFWDMSESPAKQQELRTILGGIKTASD